MTKFFDNDLCLSKIKIDDKLKTYGKNQADISNNRMNISNNIASIDTNYSEMSQNPVKYDFTGPTIYALEKEDRSLSAALSKDNAIYEQEQNNL